MLRTNLATRPFYNERAVHLALALAALLVLALTGWNIYRIVTLSQHNTELSARIGRDEAEAERLTASAADVRKTINRDELETVVAAAREANALIDQRTFSWTEFFNHIEATLPPDVMLTAVRPEVREGQTHVQMVVLARRAEDVTEFIEKLEATGAFEHVLATLQTMTDQGLYRVTLQSIYTGLAGEPENADENAQSPASSSQPPASSSEPPASSSQPPPSSPQRTPKAASDTKPGGRG